MRIHQSPKFGDFQIFVSHGWLFGTHQEKMRSHDVVTNTRALKKVEGKEKNMLG